MLPATKSDEGNSVPGASGNTPRVNSQSRPWFQVRIVVIDESCRTTTNAVATNARWRFSSTAGVTIRARKGRKSLRQP
ncbi:hypothetical protein ACH61_03222 [Rathayibacter tanaceti]|uniref:Uncharacterized protein n=1 Tax=Rathayibacter tanaceti TaxID=1671680 RepID=A0A166GZW0_9MICO|nr:hypothetical protein ACH61_03222 [Rathayibacter tanaceti]